MASEQISKLKNLFLTFIAIIFVVTSLAFAATPFEMPDLSTDEKKLEWLLKVKNEVPGLFSDAATYDINLFKLLDDQARLQTVLAQNPEYQKAMEKMHQEYLSISIAPKTEQKVKAYKISREAIAHWKENLKNTFNSLHKNLNEEISDQVKLIGTKSSKGLETGLVMGLTAEERKRILSLPASEKLQVLEKELPNIMGDSFKASNFGFTSPPKKEEVLSLLKKLQADEKRLNALVELHLVMQNAEGEIVNPSTALIDGLDDHALSLFAEGDGVSVKIKNVNLTNSKELSQTIKKHLKSFAEEQEVIEEKIGQAITLSEMPPAMGIFRGCTGGDCSTQFSFPYPNAPNEKVFYIYNQQNEVKGYVSGNIVSADGKPSFQIITIAGPRVSAADTEIIMQGLDSAKERLGVTQIVLPAQENINGLINYPEIKKVFEKKAIGKTPVSQYYVDKEFRSGVETFQSTYNDGEYDKMARNSSVVTFEPSKELSLKVDVTAKDSSKLAGKIENPKNAVLEFAFDLMSSARGKQMSQLLQAAHFSSEEQQELKENIINQQGLTISEYQEKVKKWFNYTDEEFRTKRNYFMPGLSNAKDAVAMADDPEYLTYLEKSMKKEPFKVFKNYNNPKVLSNLLERGKPETLGFLTVHLFATKDGDQFPELFKKVIDKGEQESMNALAYFGFNGTETPIRNEVFEYFIKHANEESLTTMARMCPKFKKPPHTEQWHALLKKYLEAADHEELHVFSAQSYSMIKSAESADLVSYLIRKGDREVWKNISNHPLSLELREQNKLLIKTADPITLRNILFSTFTKPTSEVFEEEMILIIENSNPDTRQKLARDYFSLPHLGKMKLALKKFIETSSLSELEDLAQYAFSQPHAEDKADLIELLIEKSKKDQRIGKALARYTFSQPHTKGMESSLIKLIEVADSETRQAIIHGVFTQPHSENMHTALNLIIDGADSPTMQTLAMFSFSGKHAAKFEPELKKLIEKADAKTLEHLTKDTLTKSPWTERKYGHLIKLATQKVQGPAPAVKNNSKFCSRLYGVIFDRFFH